MSARFPAAWLRLWRERKSERPTLNCPTKGPDRGLQCLGDLAPRLTRRSTSADVLAIEKPQRSADWPAAPSTSFLSAPEPYDAITDQTALELGDRTEHMEQECRRRLLARWRLTELFSWRTAIEEQLPCPPEQEHGAVGRLGLGAHWITSSARNSSDGGIVRPRALAVLRLMTSSNLVGCSTGKSAGLAPLRILST